MNFTSKFGIGEDVYFVELPWAREADISNVNIVSGTTAMFLTNGKEKAYNIRGQGIFYKEINQRLVFSNKEEAEVYIFKTYFKGSK